MLQRARRRAWTPADCICLSLLSASFVLASRRAYPAAAGKLYTYVATQTGESTSL